MKHAIVVDWLGRGGIAQLTPSWVAALERTGHTVTIVTRRDRELRGPNVLGPAEARHALVTHRRLAHLAAATVDDLRPDVVVIQNYVVPPLERSLDEAIARTGSRAVVVVHDHRLHSVAAGTRLGLRRRLRDADRVVAHTHFVADAVAAYAGRAAVDVVPLPPQSLGRDGRSVLEPVAARHTAINFGVVGRGYKGADVVCDLAASGVDGWRFAIAGVGAPTDRAGVTGVDRFVPAPDLAATVEASTAALLPYRSASQSGAVVLAQSLGTVPVVSGVGGVLEQVTDGVDGLLLSPDASLDAWRAALDRVAVDHDALSRGARARADLAEITFRERVDALF